MARKSHEIGESSVPRAAPAAISAASGGESSDGNSRGAQIKQKATQLFVKWRKTKHAEAVKRTFFIIVIMVLIGFTILASLKSRGCKDKNQNCNEFTRFMRIMAYGSLGAIAAGATGATLYHYANLDENTESGHSSSSSSS
jgi:cellobiose-specific phosphotransferase system component IIC